MYAQVSRRTTSLLICASIFIHVWLLLALFISYRLHKVNPLISTRHEKAVVLSQGSPKPAAVVFQPPRRATPHVALQDNPAPTPAPVQAASAIDLKLPEATHALNTTHAQSITDNDPTLLKPPKEQRTTAENNDPKPKVTMQSLAQGFLKSVQSERGVTPKHLNTHDMVMQGYQTKVMRLLQKSVFLESKPIHMTHAISTMAEILLTIDKKGAIVNFELRHALPPQELRAVEALLRHAAYSTGLYPNFPRIFKNDTFTLCYPLQIDVHAGIDCYQLTTR